jgi:hypothetical protein
VWIVLVYPRWKGIVGVQREWLTEVRHARLNLGAKLCLVTFAAIVLWNLFTAWYLPPRDWDSLAYHLPIAATYYQEHTIRLIPSPSVWVRYYPIDGELLQLWNVMFVRDDRLIEIAFLPAIVTGLLAVYGLARELGASRSSAVLGAAIVAFATGTLVEMAMSLNDALLAALVAMGMYIVVALLPHRRFVGGSATWIAAAGVGTAGGLCAGVKFNGAVYSVGLVVLFVYSAIASRRHGEGGRASKARPLIGSLAAIVLIGLALSIYPLVRNVMSAGNPLAPFDVSLGRWRLFEGQKQIEEFIGWTTPPEVVDKGVLARFLYVWREPTGSVYDLSLGGLGGGWFAVGLPAALVWLGYAILQRRTVDLMLCGLLVAGVMATPAPWNARYILPILIFGGLSTALILDRLVPFVRASVSGVIVVLALLSVAGAVPPYSTGADDLIGVITASDSRDRSSPQFMHPTWGREAFRWIDEETKARPATIAYGKLVPFIYPLYGTNWRNKVVHLLPQGQLDWTATLSSGGIELVIVNRDTPNYEWTLTDDSYEVAIEDGSYVVFRRTQ